MIDRLLFFSAYAGCTIFVLTAMWHAAGLVRRAWEERSARRTAVRAGTWMPWGEVAARCERGRGAIIVNDRGWVGGRFWWTGDLDAELNRHPDADVPGSEFGFLTSPPLSLRSAKRLRRTFPAVEVKVIAPVATL